MEKINYEPSDVLISLREPYDKKTVWIHPKSDNIEVKIFDNGNLIYNSPTTTEISEYSKKDLDTFWDEIKRLDNPHKYFVDLSKKLWELKNELLNN